VKQSALYVSIATIVLLQTGASKGDEVFLPQANIGRVTALLGHVAPASMSAATMVAAPVNAAAVQPSVNATSAPKQNISQLSQVGTNNNALITQAGNANLSTMSQQGRGNVAVVSQSNRSH
jgi:Curlin associated repeat